MANEKRYDGLDALKIICSFLVVCIHAPFDGTFGIIFEDLCVVAVPCFFMISGFFFPRILSKGKENKQLIKILKITTISLACYFVWTWLFYKIANLDFSYIIDRLLSFNGAVKFVFFNESLFGYHLWYMMAFVWVLLMVKIANMMGMKKLLLCVSPLLFVPGILLGRYANLSLGHFVALSFSRNCYFLGLPCFCMGWIVAENLAWIKSKLNKKFLLAAVIFFGLMGPVEHQILTWFGCDAEGDLFISTPFYALSVFLYFLLFFRGERLSNLGRKYSAGIYFVHVALLEITYHVISKTGFSAYYLKLEPIIIFFLSLFVVFVWKKITVGKKAV